MTVTTDVLVAALAELVVAPLAFGLAALHLFRATGGRRAALELLALSLYGYVVERIGLAWFDRYHYGTGFRLAPLGVPIAVALVWCALLVAAEAMAAAAVRRPLVVAAVATGIGLLLDATMEGVARRAALWTWIPPGDVLGAPLGNFVGWACIIFPWVWVRRRGGGRLPAGLAGSLTLLVIGTAWNRLGLEDRLHAAGAVIVCAVAAAALVAVALRRRALPPLAALTALALVAGFGAFAVLLGEGRRVAAGSLLALALAIAAGARSKRRGRPLPEALLTRSRGADTLQVDARSRPRRAPRNTD